MIGALALILLTAAARAETCEHDFDLPTLSGPEFYRLRANDPKDDFPPGFAETFAREGLVELRRIAAENDMTILQLLEDVLENLHLLWEFNPDIPSDVLRVRMRQLASDCANVERLIGRTKFKLAHHQRLRGVMSVLQITGTVIARNEIKRDGYTRINPYGKFTAAYVGNLLHAAEEGQLDQALMEVEARRLRQDRQLAEFSERLSAEPVVTTDEAVAPPAPTDETAPAPSNDMVFSPETNLAAILKADLPLSADFAYDAFTAQGLQLSVHLSPGLLKQQENGQRPAVRRLLKGILVGREHAGVKRLPALGPRVVEVKAMLHGHKRILGCLEGRTLRLIRMIDIKDDGATYSRRIPRDLCE